jgi:hypothetical protein
VAQRQRAEAIAKREEADSLTELVANSASNLSASLNQGESSTQSITNLSLTAVRNAATPTLVKLPRAAPVWQISLQLDSNTSAFTKYILKLRTLESAVPLWQGETMATEARLFVTIPAEVLKTGVYSLSLMGGNTAQPEQFAGELFLRLVKE